MVNELTLKEIQRIFGDNESSSLMSDLNKSDLSILLADDHPLLLKGLEAYLIAAGYRIVGIASDGQEALDMLIEMKPMLAILDIDMPHHTGLELAKLGYAQELNTRFILLSYLKEPEFILQAKKSNIRGYLVKEDAINEIDRCIHHVMRGEEYFSQTLNQIDVTNAENVHDCIQSLTPSERKILSLIASGQSSQMISDFLHVSPRTIEKHRSNIIAKLGIASQTFSLSQWALKNSHLIN